jgi:transcriptional regulator with XRE-family HTH domain
MELTWIGEALRRLRLANGWTQLELAERSGVNNTSLSGYENGDRLPHLSTVARLLSALDRDFADLQEILTMVEGEKRGARAPASGSTGAGRWRSTATGKAFLVIDVTEDLGEVSAGANDPITGAASAVQRLLTRRGVELATDAQQTSGSEEERAALDIQDEEEAASLDGSGSMPNAG